MVVIAVWTRREKVKDQDVDKAHGNTEGVYSRGELLHVVASVDVKLSTYRV